MWIDSGSTGNAIQGNWIGTDATGQYPAPNNDDGALLIGANNALIGNVISANITTDVLLVGSGNLVAGNLINTTADGLAALSTNTFGGLVIAASNNTIGGTTAAARNIISGVNSGDGMTIQNQTDNNLIEGNYIGTDITGTVALRSGVGIDWAVSGGANPSNNTISGNVISGNGNGIFLRGTGADANVIASNIIGLTADGSTALGNNTGIVIQSGPDNSTIGGTAAGAGNVISGNGNGIFISGDNDPSNGQFNADFVTGTLIAGNLIGTDPSGTKITDAGGNSLGNSGDGIDLSDFAYDNSIGGAGSGNIISGNSGDAIYIFGTDDTGNVVQGNFIGTDINGAVSLPNSSGGIVLDTTASNTIGGTDAGDGNIISGNNGPGVTVTGNGALTGTVAWFPADFNISDVVGGRNGIPQGNNGFSFTTGVTGNDGAFQFGSSSDYVDVHDDPGLDPTTVSVEVWVQSGVSPTTPTYIIDKGADSSGDASYGLMALSNGVEFTISDGAGNTVFAGVQFNGSTFWDGATWHHVVGTFDGTNVILYVDGHELASSPVPTNFHIGYGFSGNGTSNDLLIGAFNEANPSGFFNGNVDDVSIYNRAVTATEVQQLFQLDDNSKDGGNAIQGNFIGTDATGTNALANVGDGILLQTTAYNNTIGGTSTGDRNIISGNQQNGVNIDPTHPVGVAAQFNVVEGNFIGTDVSGTSAVPNGLDPTTTTTAYAGVLIDGDTNNTIGGSTPGAGNVISGNLNSSNPYIYGVLIEHNASGNVVLGNYIGPDASGETALGNQRSGVAIVDASDNTIGGSDPFTDASHNINTVSATANVISGNGEAGVFIQGASASGNLVQGNLIGTDASGFGPLPPTFADSDTTSEGSGVVIDGAPDNTIGGTVTIQHVANQGNYRYSNGNVISGNPGSGLVIQDFFESDSATGNLVEGNLIGTNFVGTAAVPNGAWGVGVADTWDNTIGGASPLVDGIPSGAVNVISGNDQGGVDIIGGNASGNVVAGNNIGVDVNGGGTLGNQYSGVFVGDAAPIDFSIGFTVFNENGPLTGAAYDNTIGGSTTDNRGNIIANNFEEGVDIWGPDANGNLVSGNKIGIDSSGAAGNGRDGVWIALGAADNTIGGQVLNGEVAPGSGNDIEANGFSGVDISNPDTSGNVVAGNAITGNSENGVLIAAGAADNTIGSSNNGLFPASQTQTISFFNEPDAFAYPLFEVTGDFTNNGHEDIVTFMSDGTIWTSLGNGDGTFQAPFEAASQLPSTPAYAAVGDFNNDGDLDLAVTFADSGGLYILTGNGDGTFTFETSYSTPSGQDPVVAGYFGPNSTVGGGNNLDLVVLGSDDQLVPFVGNGDGTFTAGSTFGAENSNGFGQLVSADFNHNGKPDLAVLTGDDVLIYSGNGDGTFSSTPVATIPTGLTFPGSLAVGNFPNHPDSLLVGDRTDGQILVVEDTSTNFTFSFQPQTVLNGGSDVASLAVGDFNGDGNSDIASMSSGQSTVSVFESTADGRFLQPVVVTLPGNNQNFITTDDFNGDGVSDLVAPGTGPATNVPASISVLLGSNADYLAINVIDQNGGGGVQISDSGTTGNVVAGNHIGTDLSGTVAFDSQSNLLGNSLDGVRIIDGASTNTIGGTAPAQRNIISLNGGDGVFVSDSGTENDLIQGNYIGTDGSGQVAFGNKVSGIQVEGGASNIVIDTNVISANESEPPPPPMITSGIDIIGPATSGVLVTGNLIDLAADGSTPLGNVGDGIDIANSPDNTIGGTTTAAQRHQRQHL